MLQLDKVVAAALDDAMTTFRGNLGTLVPQLFWAETAANQTAIETWFGNAANTVPVQVGYPLRPIVQPGVWCILQAGQELDREELAQYGYAGITDTTRTYQLPILEEVACIVAAPNQDYVLWLQGVVRWGLYVQRPLLQETYGLNDQRVTLSPLEPMPDSQQDVIFPFRRVVSVRAWYYDFWAPLPTIPVTGATVTVEVQDG